MRRGLLERRQVGGPRDVGFSPNQSVVPDPYEPGQFQCSVSIHCGVSHDTAGVEQDSRCVP